LITPLRYPAFPQTNSQIISDDEFYISRLKNKKFFDQELLNCKTVEEILFLEECRAKSVLRHENGLKMRDVRKASSYSISSDDDYPGIPVSVMLPHAIANGYLDNQKKNSYKIVTDENYYTQEEWEQKEESVENIADEIQDVLSNVSKIIKDVSKDIDLSNTEHLYELAKKSEWKLMMDFQGFTLPGNSDSYKTCGTWRFSVCREHSYGKRIIHSCNRLSCPTCVKKAGQRIAKKIERRIWLYGLMIQKQSNQRRNPKPSHIIESIPADDIFWKWSKSKQQRVLKEMRRIAGITGGVSITHYWRFEAQKKNPYVSIHNHLIAFGWVSPTAKQDVFKKFGVNVVYHKPEGGTLFNRKNVFLVTYYLLSHCAIKKDKHSGHWFGDLSYRKVKNSYLKQFRDDVYIDEDAEIEKSKSCKMCGELLVPAKLNKHFHNWQGFLPDDEDMDNGCMFPDGLLLELDFFSEKMEFYTSNYTMIHHRTRREINKERIESNSLLYVRKTINQKILSWM